MRAFAGNGVRDANHGEIAQVYVDCFCSVVDLTGVGRGCPDMLVGLLGITDLVEVKTEDGRVRPLQKNFDREWRGSKIRFIRTRDEAMAHVQDMSRRASRIR